MTTQPLSRSELAAIDIVPSQAAAKTRIAKAQAVVDGNGITRQHLTAMTVNEILDLVENGAADNGGPCMTQTEIRTLRRALVIVQNNL
jgi:hypothetical protein